MNFRINENILSKIKPVLFEQTTAKQNTKHEAHSQFPPHQLQIFGQNNMLEKSRGKGTAEDRISVYKVFGNTVAVQHTLR